MGNIQLHVSAVCSHKAEYRIISSKKFHCIIVLCYLWFCIQPDDGYIQLKHVADCFLQIKLGLGCDLAFFFIYIWWVYVHLCKSFFLMGISFLIYTTFSGTQLQHKTRSWCNNPSTGSARFDQN